MFCANFNKKYLAFTETDTSSECQGFPESQNVCLWTQFPNSKSNVGPDGNKFGTLTYQMVQYVEMHSMRWRHECVGHCVRSICYLLATCSMCTQLACACNVTRFRTRTRWCALRQAEAGHVQINDHKTFFCATLTGSHFSMCLRVPLSALVLLSDLCSNASAC